MSFSSPTPDISVIIPHLTGDLLFKCLKSLEIQEGNLNLEIIVVTSDRKTSKLLKYHPRVRCLYSNKLPAEKRNNAAAISQAKYLAFLDDDVELDKYCLLYMHQYMENHEVGMVFPKILNMEIPSKLDEAGGYLTNTGFIYARAGNGVFDRGQFNDTIPIFAGKSATCMIRGDLFVAIGKFDADFGILGEESDLAWRVWLSGNQVHYIPFATSLHAFNTIFKPTAKHYTNTRVYFNGCRNYLTMLIKNAELSKLMTMLPIHIFAWTISSVGFLLTGKFKPGIYIIMGLFYVVRNLPKILRKRKVVQITKKVNHSSIRRHIYYNPEPSYYFNRLITYVKRGLHG